MGTACHLILVSEGLQLILWVNYARVLFYTGKGSDDVATSPNDYAVGVLNTSPAWPPVGFYASCLGLVLGSALESVVHFYGLVGEIASTDSSKHPMFSKVKLRFQTNRPKQGDTPSSYAKPRKVMSAPRVFKSNSGSGMELNPDERNSCEFLDHGLTIFVIGASGDLAKKKTYPSLFALYLAGYLPEHAVIVGYARSSKSDEEFREHLDSYLKVAKDDTTTLEKKASFLAKCIYRYGGYDSAEDVGKVSQEMELLENEKGKDVSNRLFYFAIPPSVFVPIGTSIKKAALTTRGWNRLIVEKPFGHDLSSFDELSRDMSALYSEDEIYRIDHYLGKEMVQNLLVLRFANSIFEPMWNRNYISSVVITFKEDIGTQGRGGYFDSYGIIRDVMQNHLLQVLSLIAMEPPVRASGTDYSNYIRDEKVKVLNCIQPISLDETVIGQYQGDPAQNEPGYLEDPTVPKGSVTPTFATCVLRVNNARWDGVPFIMKAGKALNERKGEIRIQFRPPPGAEYMFPDVDIPVQELVMRLQPDEAVYMKVNVKSPGLATTAISSELDLSYSQRYEGTEVPDAYTRLILDVLRGKQAAFVRDDELRAAWKIFTPLLNEIEGKKIKPLPYKFGSRGPKESDELTASVGFQYHRGQYQWKTPRAQSSHL